MELSQRQMQKKAAIYGLAFGVVSLVIGIAALYLIADTKSMVVVIGSPILLSFVLPIILAVYFCLNLRKQVGGYWTFREATSGIFVLFISAYLIYSLGNYVFAHAIDPNINKAVKENIVNVTERFASKQDIPTEQIDEKIEEMREQLAEEQTQTTGKIFQSVVYAIIIIFVGSLIFAAIFKKDPPVFAKTDEY